MVLYLYVLIMFLLCRESLKLILVDKPLPEVVMSQRWHHRIVFRAPATEGPGYKDHHRATSLGPQR
jgi:hypothetical protein